jgi:hypothetical protein
MNLFARYFFSILLFFAGGSVIARHTLDSNPDSLLLQIQTGIYFEKNAGQFIRDAHYVAVDQQAAVAFYREGVATAVLNEHKSVSHQYFTRFVGMSEHVKLEAAMPSVDPTTGAVTYMSKYGTIKVKDKYRRLSYNDVWEGISAHYYEYEGALKYDFIVSPGASPKQIVLEMSGVEGVHVTAEGDLAFTTPMGVLMKGKPFSYQLIEGKKVEVSSRYMVKGKQIMFELGEYDPKQQLVIDPIALKYALVLSRMGEGIEIASVKVGPSNQHVYLAGRCDINAFLNSEFISRELPVTTNAPRKANFVSCLAKDGSSVLWTTLIGFNPKNTSDDLGAKDMVIDNEGNVYAAILGFDDYNLNLPDPMIAGVVPEYPGSPNDRNRMGLVKLSPGGDELLYFTYILPDIWGNSIQPEKRSFNERGIHLSYLGSGKVVVAYSAEIKGRMDLVPSLEPTLMPATGYNDLQVFRNRNSGQAVVDAGFSGIAKINTRMAGMQGYIGGAYVNQALVTSMAVDTTTQKIYFSFAASDFEYIDNKTVYYFYDSSGLFEDNFIPRSRFKGENSLMLALGSFNLQTLQPDQWVLHGILDPESDAAMRDGRIALLNQNELVVVTRCQLYGLDSTYPKEELNSRLSFGTDNRWLTDYEFDNGRASFTTLVKLDASDLSKVSDGVCFIPPSGDALENAVVMVDPNENIHLFATVNSLNSFQTSDAFFDAKAQGLFELNGYQKVAQYVRFDEAMNLTYAISIPIESGNVNIGGMARGQDGTTYFGIHGLINEGIVITPSYWDKEANKKVQVVNHSLRNVGVSYSTNLIAMHDVQYMDSIQAFPTNSMFCAGGLISQGANAGPLGEGVPAFVNGDGSDPSHNLPDFYLGYQKYAQNTPLGPNIRYLWQKSRNGGSTWTNIPASNKKFLKPQAESVPGEVRYRRLTIGNDTIFSNVISTQIDGAVDMQVTGPSAPVMYCPGQELPLDILISNYSGAITWQWYDGYTPLSASLVTPASGTGTSASFTASIAATSQVAGYYRLVVTDAYGCKKELFVTVQPLTAKIFSKADIQFCPGEVEQALLGPTTINPLWDYKITGPNSFEAFSIPAMVSDSGLYALRVKLKTQTEYCAGGQTSVRLRSSIPFDPELTAIPSRTVCSVDAPLALQGTTAAPAGYTFEWQPVINLSSNRVFNPIFSPTPLPNGAFPLDSVSYIFKARRVSDKCTFESSAKVRVNAAGVANAGEDLSWNSCLARSQTIGSSTIGTAFSWEVISSTFGNTINDLLQHPDFGFVTKGTTTATVVQPTLFLPATNDLDTIVIVLKTGFSPLSSTMCMATDTLRVFMGCPSIEEQNQTATSVTEYCPPIIASVGAPGSACAGPTTTLSFIPSDFATLKWEVVELDGVPQAAGSVPTGLYFVTPSGVKGSALPAPSGTNHETKVIADLSSHPGVDSIRVRLTSTYLEFGVIKQCIKFINVFSNPIAPFSLKKKFACNATYPSVVVSNSIKSGESFTVGAGDFIVAPPTGFDINWTVLTTPNSVISTNLYATLSAGYGTQNYLLTLVDSSTGCVLSDTLTVERVKLDAKAGDNNTYNGVCSGSIIQLGKGEQNPAFTYSWSPGTGMFYPSPSMPDSTVLNPYITVPNTTDPLTFTMFEYDHVSGCKTQSDVTITPTTTGLFSPGAQNVTLCPGGAGSIGPNPFLNEPPYGPTYRPGTEFSWTAGPGADESWLSSTDKQKPKLTLPSDFSGTAIFYFTAASGACTPGTGVYTVQTSLPDSDLPADITLTCDGPAELDGTYSGDEYFAFFGWSPKDGLYVDEDATTPYTGGNNQVVYAKPSQTTTYNVVGTSNNCIFERSITVHLPAGLKADAGETKVYCFGGDALTLGGQSAGPAFEWTVVGYNVNPENFSFTTLSPEQQTAFNTYLSDPTAANPTFSQAAPMPGMYKLKLVADPAGCALVDYTYVKVFDVRGMAGDDRVVCENTETIIGLEESPQRYGYNWSIISHEGTLPTITPVNRRQPKVQIGGKTVLELEVTDPLSGCVAIDQIVLDVAPRLNLTDSLGMLTCGPVNHINLTEWVAGYASLEEKKWYVSTYPSGVVPAPVDVSTNTGVTYFLYAENEFGCSDLATYQVINEVVPSPVITSNVILAGVSEINLADYTPAFSAIPGGVYKWYSAPSPLPAYELQNLFVSEGIYYCYLFGPKGCVSSESSLTVTVPFSNITAAIVPDTLSELAEGLVQFSLTNVSGSSTTGLGFTWNLPSGLEVGSIVISNTCGGTFTANPGGSTISLSGVNLPENDECTVKVSIKGIEGVYPIAPEDLMLSGRLDNFIPKDTLFILPDADYDGDGISDAYENEGGSDLYDPCDPAQMPGYKGYVWNNAVWAADDCDGDGLTNGEEYAFGSDPYDTESDGDGVSDADEKALGTNPGDPCDPTQPATYTGYNAMHPIWSAADCDSDGLTNQQELANGLNPYVADPDGDGVNDGAEIGGGSDPLDPCDPAQLPGYSGYVSTNFIWAAADCDMDGLLNGQEVIKGSDPYSADADGDGETDLTDSDPTLPCLPKQPKGYTGYVSSNPFWAQADCDDDGLLNADELTRNYFGGVPFEVAPANVTLDPYNPDTDGDGFKDNGGDFWWYWPYGHDPCQPGIGNRTWNPSYTELTDPNFVGFDTTNTIWANADCDADGIKNQKEVQIGTDIFNPDSDGDGTTDANEDSDGDGITNALECTPLTGPPSDPADPCDPVQSSSYTGYDAMNSVWSASDCDGDGVSNGAEVASSKNPYKPCDQVQTSSDNPIWQAADCDGDSLTNEEEVILGTDPNDSDSDGDGIGDGQETDPAMGMPTDPLDPCDPVQSSSYTAFDAMNSIWAAADCDGDGVSNGAEASGSKNPYDPCDQMIKSSANPDWLAADCDGDSLTNVEEVALGTDPNNIDSDGDGIDDGDEVEPEMGMSSDPLDPCDPEQMKGYTSYDETNLLWIEADCDQDGVSNGVEDQDGKDPYDPCDQSSLNPVIMGDTTVNSACPVSLSVNQYSSYLWSNGSTTQSIQFLSSSDETYSVTVTDQDGCTAVASIQIVVNEEECCLSTPTVVSIVQPTCGPPAVTGSVTLGNLPDAAWVLYQEGTVNNTYSGSTNTFTVTNLPEGIYRFRLQLSSGNCKSEPTGPFDVIIVNY